MFDIGLSELALIVVVAALVIGPKEIPTVVRKLSGWMRQLRHFSNQLRMQFDLLDESGEINKLREELQEQARYIRDAEGKLYRRYDISDLVEEKKTDESAQ